MNGMTQGERKATSILASIFALRMLGLFMIIPVFALYGRALEGATPALIGLAIGIYGLAQAILQIPVGLWADRINRKLLIIIGLILFAIGGAVAALSHTIWGVIIGRAIQGAGAISAVVMALLADLTREEQRTKAMSTIGMSIGMSFAVAFIMGPLVAGHFGLSGLFWATSILAIVGLSLLHLVPQPTVILKQHNDSYLQQFKQSLLHPELARLNVGIFVLHLVMTASFVLLPHLLIDYAHLPANKHGWVYLPIVLGGFFAAVPAIIIAEKRRKIKQVFVFGISLMALSLLVLAQEYQHYWGLLLGLSLFFIAFNLLEALGFTESQIDAANDYVCGTMTVEGAPALKEEHLPVFDCANKNGKKGVRYIHAHGHIRMMAACQPFLSGAISKTINLPNEATVEEIADCYLMSWKLGLKANALYRDGSKLSQPLSTKSDKKKKTDNVEDQINTEGGSQLVDLSKLNVDELLEEVQKRMAASTDTTFKRQLSRIVERKSMPAKRRGFTQKARIGGQVLFLRTGRSEERRVGKECRSRWSPYH